MNSNWTYSEKHIPLTQSQLMLWIGQKLHPESVAYNMAHTFEFFEPIEEKTFQKAFQILINTSDMFRLVFDENQGLPVQHIIEELTFNVDVIDASYKNYEEILDELKNRTQQSFDLNALLFDTTLIKVNNAHFIWYLNCHHLITDATSSSIILENLSRIYSSLMSDSSVSIEMPQYRDYINFESQNSKDPKLNDAKMYWAEVANSYTRIPKLYGKTNVADTSLSQRVEIVLGKERLQKLDALAQNASFRCWTKDLSYFNILFTSLSAFIYSISNLNEFVIGAISHNRTNLKFKKTPGMFVELFSIGSNYEPNDTFLTLYKKLREETNSYLKNAQPGMISTKASSSFNVVINYIKSNFSDFNNSPIVSDWIHPNHCDPAHHLRFTVHDMDNSGEYRLYFDLNESVFKDIPNEDVVRDYLKVLDTFLDHPERNIQRFDKVDTPKVLRNESINPLVKTSKRDTASYVDILSSYKTELNKNPHAKAISDGEEFLSYEDLDNRSNQLAHRLNHLGIKENSRVALYQTRSVDYIISILALMKSGGTFVPISEDQPVDRAQFIIRDAKCELILTNNQLEAKLNSTVPIVNLNALASDINKEPIDDLEFNINADQIAYILYTSGSTGQPKGVLISHLGLSNYLHWAKTFYDVSGNTKMPLFSSIGFDLTMTSTLLPLISGGEVIIYPNYDDTSDLTIIDVISQNKVDTIKLTPSHLILLQEMDLSKSNITKFIVGGENFRTSLAKAIYEKYDGRVQIFNEYGPTEATIGCIVSEYSIDYNALSAVPIGNPIKNMEAYILDANLSQVEYGDKGELFLGGLGLAIGYQNLEDLSKTKFIQNPFHSNMRLYRTGDLARYNPTGEIEYLGRIDEQVKIRGHRVELGEIESNLSDMTDILDCAVVQVERKSADISIDDITNCAECGLPSNYPQTDFDEQGVCNLCNSFKGYKHKVERYFKTEDDLKNILLPTRGKNPKYDCLSLLSGGKDSTYILARLVNMGLNVLAFTLDNGYISDQAKANMDRIVKKLGVDHVYGETEHMNAIFVDSLKRHQNVCNGCFKAIYTLSSHLAMKYQIPFIVTGLSRGQFFETRLTEELFWVNDLDVTKIDNTILEVRKLYHQEEDAIKDLMDTSIFDSGELFEKVQFVDFYRYTDVSLAEMLKFLEEKIGWVRPTDTGRSTNCLINQVGIYVHKKQKGYSNYAFPYSWDVRLGHKTRDESLDEINEYIHELEVKRIMEEIGYKEEDAVNANERLVAFYTGDKKTNEELTTYLEQKLPAYMIPSTFKHIEELPLTKNGKVNKKQLKDFDVTGLTSHSEYVVPRNEIEELLEDIWKEVLMLERIGVRDNFIKLGGHSLAAIRVTSRINEELQMDIPLNKVFNLPTIESYAKYIEETIIRLMEE